MSPERRDILLLEVQAFGRKEIPVHGRGEEKWAWLWDPIPALCGGWQLQALAVLSKMEKNKRDGLVKQCSGQVIKLKGVFCLEIIQKFLGEGKTFPWDRVKWALKGHRDILCRSGLRVSKLFFFKCLSNLPLNTAVPNFHGRSVLLPDSPCC